VPSCLVLVLLLWIFNIILSYSDVHLIYYSLLFHILRLYYLKSNLAPQLRICRLSGLSSQTGPAYRLGRGCMESNRLQLNTAQTEALWCASSRQQHLIPNAPLRVWANYIKPGIYVRNLGIYIDSDMSMKPICRGPCRAVLLPCVTYAAFVAPSLSPFWCRSSQRWFRLVWTTATSHSTAPQRVGWIVCSRCSKRQQDCMVCNSCKHDRILPLLCDLHWLRFPERLAVLEFHCRNQTAPDPEYLARQLQWTVYDEPWRRLRSASSQRLIVRRTRLRTAGDRAAAPRLWNSLPADVASSQSLATYKKWLKHFCSNSHTTDDHWLCRLPLRPSRLTTG